MADEFHDHCPRCKAELTAKLTDSQSTIIDDANASYGATKGFWVYPFIVKLADGSAKLVKAGVVNHARSCMTYASPLYRMDEPPNVIFGCPVIATGWRG